MAREVLGPLPTVDPDETQERLRGWKIVGPGLVVAATGVGAADLVATLTAGSRYGYALLWAVIVGTIMKIVLVEGAGRYSLSTGRTIFEGWRSLGRWTTWYFAPYIMIWGFVYGATAMSSSGLPLAALFPAVPLWIWAILSGLIGFALVWLGRYAVVEKITAVLVGIMFIVVVGLAVLAVPNIPNMLTGLVPMIPEGGLVYTLALAGGIGGTITLAAYGYWLREKGWATPKWMRVMQLDNTTAYVVTGIFVLSMLIVGAEVLHSAGMTVSASDRGLLDLDQVLRDRYGDFIGVMFLVGFWAASFSSVVGVWSGVSLMFADFWGNMRNKPAGHPATRPGGKYVKFYLIWLTFPPMILLALDRPIFLILLYGVLGALFMPFLAVTLLGLLNTERTPKKWRNGWFTNLVLGICAVLFVILGIYQTWDTVQGVLGGLGRVLPLRTESVSAVVGVDRAVAAVQGDVSAVRENPLWTGVPERDARAHDCTGVVPLHLLDHHVRLLLAHPSSVISGGEAIGRTHRWPGQHQSDDGAQDPAFAQCPDTTLDPRSRGEFLTGFHQENATFEVCNAWDLIGHSQLIDDFQATTPGASFVVSFMV